MNRTSTQLLVASLALMGFNLERPLGDIPPSYHGTRYRPRHRSRRNKVKGDSNPAKRFPLAHVTAQGSTLSHSQRRRAALQSMVAA